MMIRSSQPIQIINRKVYRFLQIVIVTLLANCCTGVGIKCQSCSAQEGLESDLDYVADNPASWQYIASIPLPPSELAEANREQSLMEFKLSPVVFTHARIDLADLRIFDSEGKTHPHQLRVLAPRAVRDVVPSTEFNRIEPEVGGHEVTLELLADEVDHNEVQVLTSGDRFRRAVVIDGSDDGKSWSSLTKGHVLRYEDGDQKIDVTSFSYSPSRYRYVRVRVSPDREAAADSEEIDEFTLTEVRVLRTNELPGERSEWEVQVGDREPTRVMGTAGSAWIIDLQGENVPCDRLEVEVENREFYRNIEIQAEQFSDVLGRKPFVPLYIEDQATWQRTANEAKRPMVISFPEVYTGRLRLLVADARNVPLTIRAAKVSGAARQVILQRPAMTDAKLALHFGNPLAEPPAYDFARNLPEVLEPKPTSTVLESAVANPDFVPPPLPLTERLPWLVYGVLGLVATLLLVIIASLARASIAMHDAKLQAMDGVGVAES